MKLLNLVQGSAEWKTWRRNCIGSSDAASVMGEGFMSPYKLYLNKLDLYDPVVNNAMRRGTEYEDFARQKFIAESKIFVEPCCVEHEDYAFLGTSLDGMDKERTFFIEIKTGGKEVLEMAKNGLMPKKYAIQIQHAFNVTGLDLCIYYFYDIETGDAYPIDVHRDSRYIAKLEAAEKKFWDGVLNMVPPELTDKDYNLMEGELLELAHELAPLLSTKKTIEEREKFIRDKMISLADDKNYEGGGIRMTRIPRKGTIDYNAIPELRRVDLESYRKPPSVVWRLNHK